MSLYDTASLHDFLVHTPEGGLRKMLVDNTKMTGAHFSLLIKVVRACSQEEFGEHFEKQDFPKIRVGPAESKIQEKFWGDCVSVLKDRGLLQPATATKQAA